MPCRIDVDVLHVVSDLHLGGLDGFQIFRCGRHFERLAETILAEARHARVGLVVNGDFVDFLAEHPSECFSLADAGDKLRRILSDPSFSPVTESLRRLLDVPGIVVAFNLGNHDLELALPWIGRTLVDILSEGDAARAGRLVLAFDGVGLRCRVGNATVLCMHGNEVDDWNPTDHDRIRRIARSVVRGIAVPAWTPNAGARLVVSLMNEVKGRFPFVDVLKPEGQAVLPILLVLDPTLAARIPEVLRLLPRRATDAVRMGLGWLGDGEDAQGRGEHDVGAAVSARDATAATFDPSCRAGLARSLLDEAEANHAARVEPLELVTPHLRGAALGLGTAALSVLKGLPAAESLRRALDGLDADRSFDPAAPDATYRLVDALVDPAVNAIVTGHTHLRRSLPRERGTGRYYNAGTWAALMRIAPEVRRNSTAFAELFASLGSEDLAGLGAKGLLRIEPSAASFWTENGATFGQLRGVSDTMPAFVPVPETLHRIG